MTYRILEVCGERAGIARPTRLRSVSSPEDGEQLNCAFLRKEVSDHGKGCMGKGGYGTRSNAPLVRSCAFRVNAWQVHN